MKSSFIKTALLASIFALSNVSAQEQKETKSTQDLSFLIGEWKVEQTYSPNSEKERVLKGTLVCKESLDGKYINCRWDLERPERIRALNEVYFNYNAIYDKYESIWVSSTWPIKVLMQGHLEAKEENLVLKTEATFPIENEVIEYVKGELTISNNLDDQKSFVRQTHIRTSDYEEGVWHHHMTEVAEKIVD